MKKNKEPKAEKKVSRYRFRALDAVIILLILTAVIGVYFRYNVLDQLSNRKNQKEYTVSFSIENIRYTTPNYMNIGDKIYYADDGEEMGVLIEESKNNSNRPISESPAGQLFVAEDGSVQEVFYPDETRVDVKGRMRCRGLYTEDGGFLVNGSRYLSAGQTVSVYTELVTINIVIRDIELMEE